MKQHPCRDCKKCTERGVLRFAKKATNAAMIAGTLGTSVVAAKTVSFARQNCPQCGHPMSMHQVVRGRFKD